MLRSSFTVGFSQSYCLGRVIDLCVLSILFFILLCILNDFVKLQYSVMSAMFIEGQDAKIAFDGST